MEYPARRLYAGRLYCGQQGRGDRDALSRSRLDDRVRPGPLLTLLPFGLADGLLSTLDFTTIYQTVVIYFSLLFRSLSKTQKIAVGAVVATQAFLLTQGRRSPQKRRAE